VKTNNTETNNL